LKNKPKKKIQKKKKNLKKIIYKNLRIPLSFQKKSSILKYLKIMMK